MDLLPALTRAEVCTSQGACWPRRTSEELHRGAEGESGGPLLPLRMATDLYLRVPPDATLRLAFTTAHASLAASVGADGDAQTTVFTGAAADGTAVDIDLARWAGRTVRLRLRAEPTDDGSGARWCRVDRLQLSARAPDVGPVVPAAGRPNFVLYVVDTLRADHLGCYGYGRATTPRIDRFSGSAVRFTDAVAQSSWTLSSTASILTGVTPVHHGAVAEDLAIRPGVPTLAERLKAVGYRSAGFVTNTLVSPPFGHARGFEVFRFYEEKPAKRRTVHLPSSALFRRVARWLERDGHRTPFLLYVHATDPHWPYLPPPRYFRPFHAGGFSDPSVAPAINAAWPFFFGNARWGERRGALPETDLALLRDLYDGEVRLADDFFGRLVDLLAARGLLDDTVIVLTSDHGEEFQEHGGLAHGQTLYREVLHVPLLVRLPGGEQGGTHVDHPVSHVDIVPTLLALAGLPAPAGLDGRSLFAPIDVPDDEVYSFLGLMGAALESITGREWKVVHRLGGGTRAQRHPFEAYDRVADPDERRDQAAEHDVLVGYARQRFDAIVSEKETGPAVDARQLDRLRALGYVQD